MPEAPWHRPAHPLVALLLLLWACAAPRTARAQDKEVNLFGQPPDSLVLLSGSPDSLAYLRIDRLLVLGNARTKERVIRAELDLTEGDSLRPADLRRRLEQNRRRVFNLRLFHTVICQATCRPDGRTQVSFVVRERWYLFPVPIFSLADRNLVSWLDRRDFRRVNYGLHLTQYNFRGRNERLTLNLQHGFNRKYEVFYTVPYFDRHRRLGLYVGGSFSQSHSVDFATLADRVRTFRDETAFPIRRWYVESALIWRRTIEHQTRLGVSFRHERVTDSVLVRNPRYLGSATAAPAARSAVQFEIERTLNHRDVYAYPLSGWYVQAGARARVGLTTASPSTVTLTANYAHYRPLGHQFYYAAEIEVQARLGGPVAYLDNQALGYLSTIRGYAVYVTDGQHFAVARQGLSRRLFSVERLPLPLPPGSRFGDIPVALYANLFFDAGYVRDASPLARPNTLPNRALGALGLGLHLVTYYDRVIRFEGALNHRGSPSFFIGAGFPI